jgi:hypothetical protein
VTATAHHDANERGQPPIEDYGLLGDTRTAALVSSDGSLDWMCIPRFDGQPLFGRMVGGRTAGSFRLGPAGRSKVIARRYRPRSATLETTWETADGRLTLTEGTVAEVGGRLLPSTLLVRRLSAEGGTVQAVIEFDPRLGEGRRRPRGKHRGDVLVCTWPGSAVALRSSPSVRIEPGQPTAVIIDPHRPLSLALAVADREPLVYADPAFASHDRLYSSRLISWWTLSR